ncbi:SNF2 family N-terminal domain-containing protein [Xylariomycetidae sp. FL2044]|nr:SNF2 family N-terminal domain-containing protein [Xylariomycetidae sp. FL2044]
MSGMDSSPRRATAVVPGTPDMDHGRRTGEKYHASGVKPIEIDDDDLDELATDEVPSPYFTQPTQIINRTTQPTQILGRTTQPTQLLNRRIPPSKIADRTTQPTQIVERSNLRLPSSPMAPSSPSTTVEVPASSPFQAKSQSRTASTVARKPEVSGRLGSAMAPAGTSFRAPIAQASRRIDRPAVKRQYLNISDDDLSDDYRKRDSSDGETPMRGDIRPSSFVKKGTASSSTSRPEASSASAEADISFDQIRDITMRRNTMKLHAIVQKKKPEITIRECWDTLKRGINAYHINKAANLLIGLDTAIRPEQKSQDNSTGDYATTSSKPNQPSQFQNSLQSFLHRPGTKPIVSSTSHTSKNTPTNSIRTNSIRNSSNSSALTSSNSTSTQSHNAINSTKSSSVANMSHNETSNHPGRRRRLIQGRRNRSPSPPPVFSVSSSANASSALTTPAPSEAGSPDGPRSVKKLADASSLVLFEPIHQAPRRRLQRGRRNPTPPPAVITIDSGSEEDYDVPTSRVSRKRKAKTQPKPAQKPIDLFSDSDASDDSNGSDGFIDTAGRDDEDEEVIDVDILNSQNRVLEYLNTCTAEELGRMTGLPHDAKLMCSSRPFKTITDAERVSRKENTKSKSKTKRTEIGSTMVEKLSAWFRAFDATTAVINECAQRGQIIKNIMDTWPLDKNGRPKSSESASTELPVAAQPDLLDSSVVTLKSYQLLGLNWMNLIHSQGYSGILADDMGLGKTCQVISMIAHLVGSYDENSADRAPWPNLIVVPPSTFENWVSEFERFAPDLDVFIYAGSTRREAAVEDAQDHHVVLTTYTQIEKQKEDRDWLTRLGAYAAIFDEGHKLKNSNTLIYKQMMRVPTEWRLILSGTPIQNNLKELLTLLRFVEPSLFPGDAFENLTAIFETKVANKDIHNFAALSKERIGHARSIVAPFILQRRKGDVLDLAKKIERTEIVQMHPSQKIIYDEIKGRYLATKGTKRPKSTIKEAHPWLQLRKASIHHQLFRVHFTDEKVNKMVDILWKNCSAEELHIQSKEERHKKLLVNSYLDQSDFQLHVECKHFKKYVGHLDIPEGSWEDAPKVKKLLEMVRGYMKTGDRVLVFSRFDMVIDILRETFAFAGIPYCELTGSLDTAARFPEIQRFNNDPSIPVFLLTTGAGGTGINLTAANKIVLFDQSDNPQDDVQASNRAHRIGQTRDVEVVRIITENTVEGLVYNSCVKKLLLAAYVEGQYPIDDDEEESVEEQCRKLMLLEKEEADAAAASQTA